jgi:hypothetical protein
MICIFDRITSVVDKIEFLIWLFAKINLLILTESELSKELPMFSSNSEVKLLLLNST